MPCGWVSCPQLPQANHKSREGAQRVKEMYQISISGSWREQAKWLPKEVVFGDVDDGWSVTLSREGFTTTRESYSCEDSTRYQIEARELASRLLDNVIYLANIRSTHGEPTPPTTTQITGPGSVSIVPNQISVSVSLTSHGPMPSIEDVYEFRRQLEATPRLDGAIAYYLNGLKAASESEMATELYKAIESTEVHYGSARSAYQGLRYPKSKWSSLKHNLQWLGRHTPEKLKQRPKQEMSIEDCRKTVREILEQFRGTTGAS